MATTENCRAITRLAAVDMASLMYHFGVINTAGKVTSGGTNLTAQGRVDGIVADNCGADKAFAFVVPDGGIAKVKLGATVTAGQEVATAADGRAIALGSSNGNRSYGVFLEGGDANEIVSIHFIHKGQVNA